MRRRNFLLFSAALAHAQMPKENFQLYAEAPRLLLKAQRIRFLRRERDRMASRWEHLSSLVHSEPPMSEPGFSYSLEYQISGDEAYGQKAVDFALKDSDTRQVALVRDWCSAMLTGTDREDLDAKLRKAASLTPANIQGARDVVFAALASADTTPELVQSAMEAVVHGWWRAKAVPSYKNGTSTIGHAESYALLELLHVLRDNFQLDLRDDAPDVFRDLPVARLLSYYPPIYPGSENEFRIPEGTWTKSSEPDLRTSTLSRAAEWAMVAFDRNALNMQFLQGWLSHDRFQLKGVFGAPYEFLWANPYQPGLSFHHMPLQFHDVRMGQLLIRSDWEDTATWLSYRDGKISIFRDGRLSSATLSADGAPLRVGQSAVLRGNTTMSWKLAPDDPEHWFAVGLPPNTTFQVKTPDDTKQLVSDRAGILALHLDDPRPASVRITQSRRNG
jgi:hypothetical protein